MLNSFNKRIIWLAIFFILFLAVFSLLVLNINKDKVVLGYSIAGQDYGKKDIKQTQQNIQEAIANFKDNQIIIKFKSKEIKLLPQELGLEFSPEQTLKNAISFGHTGTLLQQAKQQLFSLFFKQNKGFNFSLDQQKLREIIQKNFTQFEDPPQSATINFDSKNKSVSLSSSKSGRILNKEEILQNILVQAPQLELKEINLRLIDKEPEVSEQQIEDAFLLTKEIINNAPIELISASQSWQISASELFSWLDFKKISQEEFKKITSLIYKERSLKNNEQENDQDKNKKIVWVYFDQQKIEELLASLAPSVNQTAVNARLKNSDGQIQIAKASQPAINLNIIKSAQTITTNLYQAQKEIELAVNEKEAQINEESLQELGLTNFLGSGYSDFTGSPFSRRHNIKTGTAKFDGILIGPGEEFSFNTLLGEVDAANGYLPELVIKDKKTVPEYGGGLCQVSTTVFRAAVNSGLEITERFHHAFAVKYYNPQGFDATIYPPHPDLRFKNDTPNNILLQASLVGTELYFDVFGTADGREVKIKGPYIYESNEDGSLKAVLTQEVWHDNKLDRKKVFYSNYKSPSLYPVEKNPLE